MTCPAFQESDVVMPKARDISLAMRSSKELAALVSRKRADVRVVAQSDHKKIELILPFPAVKMLLHILTQMSEGNSLTLIPIHAELSTQEAANLLNISRPFLIKLLEKGEIAFHRVGTHRRILFKDIQSYKTKQTTVSNRALQRLTDQAQQLDMGY